MGTYVWVGMYGPEQIDRILVQYKAWEGLN